MKQRKSQSGGDLTTRPPFLFYYYNKQEVGDQLRVVFPRNNLCISAHCCTFAPQKEHDMNPSDNKISRYYDPTVCIGDLAAWLHVSYRTARRRMQTMKADLGISKHEKPKKSMVVLYFKITE